MARQHQLNRLICEIEIDADVEFDVRDRRELRCSHIYSLTTSYCDCVSHAQSSNARNVPYSIGLYYYDSTRGIGYQHCVLPLTTTAGSCKWTKIVSGELFVFKARVCAGSLRGVEDAILLLLLLLTINVFFGSRVIGRITRLTFATRLNYCAIVDFNGFQVSVAAGRARRMRCWTVEHNQEQPDHPVEVTLTWVRRCLTTTRPAVGMIQANNKAASDTNFYRIERASVPADQAQIRLS